MKELNLQKQINYLMVINDFALSLIEQNTIDEIVWDVAKNAIAKLGFVDCVIYLFDEDEEFLIQKAAHGPKSPEYIDILNPITIKKGAGIVGTVAATGLPELVHDTTDDKRYIVDDAARQSEIAVPIKIGQKVLGVIDSEHPDKNFYSSFHLDVLMTIASMVATKLQQAKAQEELESYKSNLENIIEEKTHELKVALEKLERSNQAYEQFNYIVSHDLREPLRMISSYLQLLERRYKTDLPEGAKEFVHYAVDGAKRMDGLIKDLLSFSRVGRNSSPFTKVFVQDVLEQVEKSLVVSIYDTSGFILYKEMPVITARNGLMFLLFQNLIDNAIKFRGEEPPIVEITCEDKDYVWEFRVKDNGIGLPAEKEERDRIFQVFEKQHQGEETKGSGIGLAISRNIINQHGGNIWAENNEDKGASIYFTITKGLGK